MALRSHTGIWCPGCGSRLAVKQGWAVFVGFVSFLAVALCGAALIMQIEKQTWRLLTTAPKLLVIAPVAALGLWWKIRIVPRFCRVRLAPGSEAPNFPISLAESQKR